MDRFAALDGLGDVVKHLGVFMEYVDASVGEDALEVGLKVGEQFGVLVSAHREVFGVGANHFFHRDFSRIDVLIAEIVAV